LHNTAIALPEVRRSEGAIAMLLFVRRAFDTNYKVEMTTVGQPLATYRPAHKYATRQRPQLGTHKGQSCQEGIRAWPGDYVLPAGLG
jgi:hypothetical protein